MKVEAHARAYLVASVLGLIIGFFGLGFAILVRLGNLPPWLQAVVLGTSMVIGWLVVHVLFSRVVGAACPGCGRPVYLRLGRRQELVYRCRTCGVSRRTGIFLGDGE